MAPRDAKLTVGEWCDKWLAGYGTRRRSTVRQAQVHLKIIKAHFGSVTLSAVKPSDVRAWTATLKDEGRADSYIYALYSRLFTDAVHDGLVTRNPCSRRTSPGM
nr:N-terminal phage integrase SAM-like domain-containing protein [Actinomycetota bacterium]